MPGKHRGEVFISPAGQSFFLLPDILGGLCDAVWNEILGPAFSLRGRHPPFKTAPVADSQRSQDPLFKTCVRADSQRWRPPSAFGP